MNIPSFSSIHTFVIFGPFAIYYFNFLRKKSVFLTTIRDNEPELDFAGERENPSL